jgi:hypothetical protein
MQRVPLKPKFLQLTAVIIHRRPGSGHIGPRVLKSRGLMIPVLILSRTRSAASLKKRPIHQNRDTEPSTYELMCEIV